MNNALIERVVEGIVTRVFHVGTECSGVVSDGGLGDVVMQIAKQCSAEGFDTTIILPLYGKMDEAFWNEYGAKIEALRASARPHSIPLKFPGKSDFGDATEPCRFIVLDYPVEDRVVHICLIDTERFNRRNRPYGRPPYPDVYPINILLQKAALQYIADMTRGTSKRDVVIHGHDGHVGTLAMIARSANYLNGDLAECTYITTAHNCGVAYRQRLWMTDFESEIAFLTSVLGVDRSEILKCIVVDREQPGFEPFAAAAVFGDAVTLVSEGYAWEIAQSGRSATAQGDVDALAFARFLDPERRRLEDKAPLRATITGITNGIDPAEVGPDAIPREVRPSRFPKDFAWKKQFKTHFLERLKGRTDRPAYWSQIQSSVGSAERLDVDSCLFTYVGRLDVQKGMDILARAVTEVLAFVPTAGLVVLGGGDVPELTELAHRFPGSVIVLNGRSEDVAKEIYAAGDFFLLPSRFEPCGLTDFRAQLNGNIPVANQVGGLSKIVNGKTGLGFFGLGDRAILRGLVDGMLRALDLFEDAPSISRIQRMAEQHVRDAYTWPKVFPAFRRIYEAGATRTDDVTRVA